MDRRQFSAALGTLGAWLARPFSTANAAPPPAGTDRFGDPLPAVAIARFGTTRFWHEPGPLGPRSLAVSPDGRFLATAGIDYPVILWDAATGREVRRFGAQTIRNDPFEPIHSVIGPVAFAADGATLAVGHAGGEVKRWEVATGKALPPFTGHGAAVVGLAFSADGKTLVTGDDEGFVLVREAGSGRIRHRFATEGDAIPLAALAASADGSVVATSGVHGPVTLWDAATGAWLRETTRPRFDFAWHRCLAVSPDGATVAAGLGGYQILAWDARTGQPRFETGEKQDQDVRDGDVFKGHDRVAALAFSADGKTLASAGADNSVRLRDAARGTEHRRLDWAEGEAEAVAFSPDGRRLAATGESGAVRVWDVAAGREALRGEVHRAAVTHVAFSADGRAVTSVGRDGAACVFDPATGATLTRKSLLPRVCYATALSADGSLLAYQGLVSDRRVVVVSTATGEVRRRFDLSSDKGGVITSAFSADGKTLVLGESERDDERVVVAAREVEGGADRWRFEAGLEEFFDVLTLSPDGKSLATVWNRTVRVYDAGPGRLRFEAETGDTLDRDVTAVAFAPDSRSLAVAQRGGVIESWDAATGRRRPLARAKEGVFRLAFAPDGRTLATSGWDDPTVTLRDAATGRDLSRLEGHRGWVWALAFAPDGRRLASGGTDTTVLVWDVAAIRGL